MCTYTYTYIETKHDYRTMILDWVSSCKYGGTMSKQILLITWYLELHDIEWQISQSDSCSHSNTSSACDRPQDIREDDRVIVLRVLTHPRISLLDNLQEYQRCNLRVKEWDNLQVSLYDKQQCNLRISQRGNLEQWYDRSSCWDTLTLRWW